ncbi:MAG: heavy metal translocating P-type ATPase metal-binding domain-containing protein [Methylococcales bacterium]
MSETKKTCDLCGLTVEVSGFTLKTKEGDKAFCCEGCLGIYQMLHVDQVTTEPKQPS